MTGRAEVLRAFGAGSSEVEELLAYNRNRFESCANAAPGDEAFVPEWEHYAREVQQAGSIDVLARYLPQLRFPIQAGISEDASYTAAVRRGAEVWGAGLQLCAPESCRVFLRDTPAGRIPVIVAAEREDFESLLRALVRRNEPAPVSESLGATIVSGYNNWHRISLLRERSTFAEIRAQRHLYQDRFILCSSGPYSGVAAEELNAENWDRKSLDIRIEHEATHYCTLRLFSSMRNSLHDEVIADFFGIRAAIGRYRSDWAERFLRGRMHLYRGEPPLSPSAFQVLGSLAAAAARNLERFDASGCALLDAPDDKRAALAALTSMHLEELGSPDALPLLARRMTEYGG